MIEPTRSRILVDPLYDAEKVYGLYMPDSGKNPMSQMGEIIALGPENYLELEVGQFIAYHPFRGIPVHLGANGKVHEYLWINPVDVAAILTKEGEVFPLPYQVVVAPEFVGGDLLKHGSLLLPQNDLFNTIIPNLGKVLRVGRHITEVKVGQRVMFRFNETFEGCGNEIGIDTGKHRGVYYTLLEEDLLATVED